MNDKEARRIALKALNRQRRRKGWGKGENHNNTSLKETDVLTIVKEHEAGTTQAELARQYDVTTTTIGNIINGHTWSDLTGFFPKVRRITKTRQKKIRDDWALRNPDGTKTYNVRALSRKYKTTIKTVRDIIHERY